MAKSAARYFFDFFAFRYAVREYTPRTIHITARAQRSATEAAGSSRASSDEGTEEAERMLNPIAENKSDIAIGQEVEVINGQLEGVKVVVQDIDLARGKIMVLVKLLGRENSLEINIEDVRPVE